MNQTLTRTQVLQYIIQFSNAVKMAEKQVADWESGKNNTKKTTTARQQKMIAFSEGQLAHEKRRLARFESYLATAK